MAAAIDLPVNIMGRMPTERGVIRSEMYSEDPTKVILMSESSRQSEKRDIEFHHDSTKKYEIYLAAILEKPNLKTTKKLLLPCIAGWNGARHKQRRYIAQRPMKGARGADIPFSNDNKGS